MITRETLENAFAAGCKHNGAVADYLELPYPTVYAALRREGFYLPRKNGGRTVEIIVMLQAGWAVRDIADKLGITRQRVGKLKGDWLEENRVLRGD